MKTQVRGASTSTGLDAFQSNAFTIAVNNKSFRVLLDTLYTNKVRAFVRELWTNAFDSHVQAGTPDKPFLCDLPNALAPTFTVRDFGVSMTHDEVMHRYTTVFESSKEETNDQVGCLGLGSKSPFAYTDSFQVTAWLDGVKRLYLAAIGSEGIPTITFLAEEESDEPTGIEVSFPVEQRDFNTVRTEARYVATGFDTPPDISGLDLTRDEPTLSGLGWRVQKDQTNSIRQGCVLYPVTDYQLAIHTGLNYGFGLIVDVPIGTVDVAANREALSFDDTTIAHTKAAFAAAVLQIEETVADYIDQAGSLFEANQRWVEMNGLLRSVPSTLWHNQVLNGTIEFKPNHPNTPALYGYDEKKEDKVRFHVDSCPQQTFIIDRTDKKIPRKRTRFRAYRNNFKYTKSHLHIIKDPTSKQLSSLVRRLQLRPDQIISMEALPDVVITRGQRGKTDHVPGVYTATRHGYSTVTEVEDDFLWVGIERITSAIDLFSRGYNNNTAFDVVANGSVEIGNDLPIYFISPTAQKRLKVDETTAFETVFKAWVDANQADILEEHKVAATASQVQSNSRTWLSESVLNKLLADLHPSAYNCKARNFNLTGVVLLEELAEVRLEAEEAATAIAEKYPLIFHNGDDSDILDYINQKG